MNITVTTASMAASILSALTLTLVPTAPCRPAAGPSQASAQVSEQDSGPGLRTAMATEVAWGRAMGEAAMQVAGPASVQAWALAPMGDAVSACRPASAPFWT